MTEEQGAQQRGAEAYGQTAQDPLTQAYYQGMADYQAALGEQGQCSCYGLNEYESYGQDPYASYGYGQDLYAGYGEDPYAAYGQDLYAGYGQETYAGYGQEGYDPVTEAYYQGLGDYEASLSGAGYETGYEEMMNAQYPYGGYEQQGADP